MANKKNDTKLSDIRQRTHESVDNIMDKAEGVRDGGKEKMTYMKDKVVMMKENVDGYIQENPGKSVLIAAGVGAVAGAVLTAAMMRRKQ